MSAGIEAPCHGVVSQRSTEILDENATVIPVGLDFGPTGIANCFSIVSIEGAEEAEGKYWTGVPCSQVCKDFYQETLSKKVQSHLDSVDSFQSAAPLVPTEARSAELAQAFAGHIKEARGMGVSALDYDPLLNFKVMAITVPEHWDVSARTMVAKAAQMAGEPLDSSSMILRLPQAVRLAYRMRIDTGHGCLVVLVYYHETHLHLMLVQMSAAGFAVKRQVYLPHLGEHAILKASVTDSPAHDDTADSQIIYETTYRGDLQPILEALQKFLVVTTLSHDPNLLKKLPYVLKYAVSDVRCIVVDGEACNKGREALRTAIKKMFADMTWLSVTETHECGAYGASVAAQMQLQNPKHLGDWRDLPGYLPENDV